MIKKGGEYVSTEELLAQYNPLVLSIYKKFSGWSGLFYCSADYEDLMSTIRLEFIRLCSEFDPTRGVHFPGFIKFHLQQRVYHNVIRLQKRTNKETTQYNYYKDNDDSLSSIYDKSDTDLSVFDGFNRIDYVNSLDWRAILGKKHKRLIEAILYENRTIEDIAYEDGVTIKVVRLRLHFACKRLFDWHNLVKEYEEYKISHPWETFNGYLTLKQSRRSVSDVIRTPFVTRTPVTFTSVN